MFYPGGLGCRFCGGSPGGLALLFVDLRRMGEKRCFYFHGRRDETGLFWKCGYRFCFDGEMVLRDPHGGCAEVVKKLKTYIASNSDQSLSVSTGSYCKARKKLAETDLIEILKYTAESFHVNCDDQPREGRSIIVVDGILSMADSPENQAEWPRISSQKAGYGFPTMRLLGCFDLATGAILSYEVGNKKNHELPLLCKQEDTFKEGDIFLGDKGFCSFYDVDRLREKGIDSVFPLAREYQKRNRPASKSWRKMIS